MDRSRWRLFDDESSRLDQFGRLLAVATVAVVGLSLVDLSPDARTDRLDVGTLVVTAFVALMFMLAMRATGVARRWRRIADIVLGVGYVATVAVVVVGPETAPDDHFRPSVVWSLLAVLMPVAVIRRVVKQREVTVATLVGAVAAYLLLAFGFFIVFLSVDAFQRAPFFGERADTTEFMYFSLVTVTTLGYGDLSPDTELARLVAATEAVIGQVFLVTLVAGLVSRFAARDRSDGGTASPTTETT